MRCSKAREFLSRHLDEQLPPAQTGDLTRHLDGCADCREYREDLLIGQRLLAATEPELPENFDWKLQLRLKQTLREAAGEAVLPWEGSPRRERWAFLRSFGAATAAGMAAVLGLAMFIGPQVAPRGAAFLADVGGDDPQTTAMVAAETGDAGDRLPLYLSQPRGSAFARTGSGTGLPVSGGNRSGDWRLQSIRDWSGRGVDAPLEMERLRTENLRLRLENRQMGTFIVRYRQQFEASQTRLDTTAADPLDLHDDR